MDFITTIMTTAESIPAWIAAITAFMVACKAITVITPTTIDDELYGKVAAVWNTVSRVLNIVALNVGRAKNADDEPAGDN
jgi:hypothetical protein